jgi:hypothetical protein
MKSLAPRPAAAVSPCLLILIYQFVLIAAWLIASTFDLPSNAQTVVMSSDNAWKELRSRAHSEGKLVVWGPLGDDARIALTSGFIKNFPGIDLDYQPIPGAAAAPRILMEQRVNQHTVDIHIGGTTTMLESLLKQRALDPIKPVLFHPAVTNPYRKRTTRGQVAVVGKSVTGSVLRIGICMLRRDGQKLIRSFVQVVASRLLA